MVPLRRKEEKQAAEWKEKFASLCPLCLPASVSWQEKNKKTSLTVSLWCQMILKLDSATKVCQIPECFPEEGSSSSSVGIERLFKLNWPSTTVLLTVHCRYTASYHRIRTHCVIFLYCSPQAQFSFSPLKFKFQAKVCCTSVFLYRAWKDHRWFKEFRKKKKRKREKKASIFL